MDTEALPVEQDPEEVSLTEILTGRANSYRVFSRLFLKPLAPEEIEDLAAADYIAVAKALQGEDLLAEGFNDMGRALRRRNTGTQQELATDYTMCFDGVETYKDEVAVPYASVFIGEEKQLNQEPRHQVYHIFKAESLGLKGGINLPEDHLSFELEFLAILSDRTAQALEADNREEALRCLELSREFIVEQILSWYSPFWELALKILKTRFYQGVLKATRGYLELDLTTIADLLEEI